MDNDKISAQDLRDFQEGRTGPAGDLYTHIVGKLIELIDPDFRRIFMQDLVNHATGTTEVSMQLTFRTIARMHKVVTEEAQALSIQSDGPFLTPFDLHSAIR